MNILNTLNPRPFPPMPTTYAPGSPEKEAVFCERLRMHYQLHHPADARYEGDTLPLEWVKWYNQVKKERLEAATRRIFDKIKLKKQQDLQGISTISTLFPDSVKQNGASSV